MALSHRLLSLDTDPHRLGGLGFAPPPYPKQQSSFDDDTTSGLWSSTSTTFVGRGYRRSSWSNLVDTDEHLTKYRGSNTVINAYPNIISPNTSMAGSTTYSAAPLPPKSSAYHGSQMSMTQSTFGNAGIGLNYNQMPRPLSQQHSYVTNNSVSEHFVLPKGSIQKLNYASPMPQGATPIPLDNPSNFGSEIREKKDRMESLRQCWRKPVSKLICGLITLLLITGIILAIVLPLTLIKPNHYQFNWLAPDLVRNRQTASNVLSLDIEGDQARFNLHGAVPFRSNFVSIYDFKTNKVAIIDSSLQSNGKTLICFVMDLNKQNMPSISELKTAAYNARHKTNQTNGWQETWNFVPSPQTNFNSATNFHPDISQCHGARWVELNYVNSNQKPMKCSDCYDFCLPDYGIERDMVRNEQYLNIVRRSCFYLYVAEWRGFAQAYTNAPGQMVQTNTQLQQNPFGQNNQNQNFGLPGINGNVGGGGGGGAGFTGQNQFGQNGQIQNQFGQNQQVGGQFPGQQGNQFGQNNGQNQFGLNQFGQPNQANPNQFGQFGQQNGVNQFGQNQNQLGPNGQPIGQNGGGPESRWINLNVPNVPQQIANATSNIAGQIGQTASNAIDSTQNQLNQWGQQLGQNLGILPNQQQNQQSGSGLSNALLGLNNGNAPGSSGTGNLANPSAIFNQSPNQNPSGNFGGGQQANMGQGGFGATPGFNGYGPGSGATNGGNMGPAYNIQGQGQNLGGYNAQTGFQQPGQNQQAPGMISSGLQQTQLTNNPSTFFNNNNPNQQQPQVRKS
uniref:BRICHOS domain-containing protein n=1 Tax=Panagrellus redivivus TaxID=6233 RepID=A0A7E4UNF6_PANRE